MRHTPTHSALPNWREPVAHPLTTRMSSNLGFRVINPLASPNLGGTSCASDRVSWPNLSFPRTRRQAGSGSAQSLRARHAHAPGPRAIFLFLVQRSIEPRPRAPLRGLRGENENRPSELRKRDFRAGAPTARFSSWPRKRPFFARVHMKSSHFSSTQRIGDAPKVRLSQAAVLC